jgi:signal transduction histidine kinase
VQELAHQSGLGPNDLLARLVGDAWRSQSGSENILENISDAFLRIDRQWRFVYLNTHSERLLQRPRQELLGCNVWEEFPEAVGSRFQREFVQTMETGVPAWFEEYYAPLETWFSVRAYPDGEGLSIHFQDISERKHILARMSELQALSRLKDDFLSTVSHELRSPLTNMRLAIRALETVDDPERRRQYLEILREQCDREVDLVNDLLDLQAAESGLLTLRIEPVFLDPWLFNLIAPFRGRAEQNTQQLSVHLDPALDRVVSDPRRLERIVSELVHNACKYTPPAGHIQIEVTRCGTSMEMCVRNAPAMIPPELLERIFEKFYRIPNQDPRHSGGSGLGLALVRELAGRLGGTVAARSTEGTTEFVLTLPLAGPPDLA